MALAFDAESVGNTANSSVSSPITASHTMSSGANGLLLVAIQYQNGSSAPAVTYNGVSMTLLKSQAGQFSDVFQIYGLANPPSGSNTISFSWTGGSNFNCFYGVSYTGAKQTGLPDASGGNSNGSGTSVATTVTVVASGSWIIGFGKGNSYSSITGFTNRGTNALGGQIGIADSNGAVSTGSNTVTLNGSGAGNDNTVVAVSIAPAITGGGAAIMASLI